ncbi:EamA family transporter [Anaerovorax odorimutans]|uniref:EamA family transporter n=1 Tax=Anaerovorax odorimutans TaxID=109327 RepID=A0ABT1RKN0_9FIRM|nr:EamA family transporter [Anaerovorax odorimutans]MCQ4635516.1 EamA family transporter [Anaerovorax odorimutans]
MPYYVPVFMVIGANVLYHICSKEVPQGINPTAALFVTYSVAALASLALFLILPGEHDLAGQLKQINWAPVVLGATIVCLEVGNILMYRIGWNISVASLVCNLGLAVLLIVVGLILYKEHISGRQVAGIVFCLVGLVLINK